MFDFQVSWHRALSYCISRGWTLPVITTKSDNEEFIKQIEESGK